MDAHVGPARRHGDGQAPPQRRACACRPTPVSSVAVNAAELAWPRRERRRGRAAHRVARVALDGRAGPAEQPLEALVDDQALGAEGQRRASGPGRRRRRRQPARDVGEVPDQAEVAEVAWPSVNTRVGDRVAAELLELQRRPTGRSGRSAGPSARRPGAAAGGGAGAGPPCSRADEGRRQRRPGPRRRPARGRRRTPGTTAGTRTTRTARSGRGRKSPVTQARSTAFHTAVVRVVMNRVDCSDGVASMVSPRAAGTSAGSRPGAGRAPARRGTSRSARRPGSSAPS